MNLELLTDALRWALIAYIISGGAHAALGAYRDHEANERNLSAPHVTARAALRILLGFLPAIPHIWRFTSSLPNAFRLEILELRYRKKRDALLRRIATIASRDEVQL